MKKKLLSLFVSFAMIMTVFAGMTVTANADEANAAAETAAFTVYSATTDADGKIFLKDTVKTYTADEFAALATKGSIGGFYMKGGVNAITSKEYVTMETLLGDAGIGTEFVTALYATETSDEGTPSVYGKCEYKKYLDGPAYIYKETKGSDEAFTGTETAQTLAISVTSAKGTVAKDQTIAQYMDATADAGTSYNVIAGSTDVTDNAGKRMAQGISGVAVIVDQTAMDTAEAKALKVKSLTVKGSKSKAVVKYKKNVAADGYKILYSKNKNFKNGTNKYKLTTKSSYTLKLKKGTYYVKVATYSKVDGKKVYGKYTSAKKVVVK